MMQVARDAPKRSALRYYGGKFNLAPWIISFFPPHLNYVEPCGGAASVLLQKPRSALETYNDLDGNVVNFFRMLRDQPDELIRRIRLTPWARAEYDLSLQACDESPIEKARRFFVACSMSLSGTILYTPSAYGWRCSTDIQIQKDPMRMSTENGLEQVAARFKGVQIEQRSYDNVIDRFDSEASLIYFDPPYTSLERTKKERYTLEWTDEDHEIAARHLRACRGYVIISGYACPLYSDLYERHGWQRHDKEAQTNSGGKRVESVWLSPRTAEAIARPQQQGLFAL